VSTSNTTQHVTNPPAAPRDLPLWRSDGQQLQVVEIFWSIEGEGLRAGQPTLFIRLSKCNLKCHFCDTQFDHVNEMTVEDLVQEVKRYDVQWVCLTGGEPLGQNILPLCQALHHQGYRLHIETNGTIDPDPDLYHFIEHWTVSPKARTIAQGLTQITELKYVVGKAFHEECVEEGRADQIYLQAESSSPEFIEKTCDILRRHPHWRMSPRLHVHFNLR